MRHVVLRKQDATRWNVQLLMDQVLHPQFLQQPGGHGVAEHLPRLRHYLHGGGQDALELDERFLVEDDVVEFLRGDAGRFQAVADGQARKIGVVFLAAEPFLFGGCDQLAIVNQGRRSVMVETRYPQYAHVQRRFVNSS